MTNLPAWQLVILGVVGAAAGFVNTVAGAGSLLSLRALMLFGLPAGVANGTNRLPVLAQSATAAIQFHREGKLERSAIVRAALPASFGALAGAYGATVVPERPMRIVLIVVLLAVALLGLRPQKKKKPPADDNTVYNNLLEPSFDPASLSSPRLIAWLFFAGAYGGFLQAGVGLVLLHALSGPGKLDLVRANALKAIVIAIFSVVAVVVFVARGQVVWLAAAPMIVGSMIGARLAVAYAIGWAHRLKIWVVVVDVVACVVLLWQS